MIRLDEPLKLLNTFGLDVSSRLFFAFSAEESLRSLWKTNLLQLTSPLVLGGGSNILFTRNYHGLILKNNIPGRELIKETSAHVWVRFGAGEPWQDCVQFAIANHWGGLENLSLIPGSIGAAPVQNIGAYGVELKDCFVELSAFDLVSGKVRTFDQSDCAFGYRDSIFKREGKGRYCILSVTLRLNKNHEFHTQYGDISTMLDSMGVKTLSIKAVSEAVMAIRRSKLPDPDVLGNCGSFFKNPVVDASHFELLKKQFPDIRSFPAGEGKVKVPAGWLIEADGWKGKRVGNTGCHQQQALVLVNYGGATGQEVADHAQRIVASVEAHFGIRLETEVNII
ncbi:MAG: UDP-N-acetylmuramate dehydrogenase [Bacteroidetes bacterium]|nr:UDP-N-acetylmuramate dehydrogenase [Bacteroidota bacterium]